MYSQDEILLCDKCNVAVHQQCYSVQTIPSGNWFCDSCAAGLITQRTSCALCPYFGGAYYPTTEGKWVHAFCCAWIPGISDNTSNFIAFSNQRIGNQTELSDITKPLLKGSKNSNENLSMQLHDSFYRSSRIQDLSGVAKQRYSLKCKLCPNQKSGACIQCDHVRCSVSAHPYCIVRKKSVMQKKRKKSCTVLSPHSSSKNSSFNDTQIVDDEDDEENAYQHPYNRFSWCVQISVSEVFYSKKVFCSRHFDDVRLPPPPNYYIERSYPPLQAIPVMPPALAPSTTSSNSKAVMVTRNSHKPSNSRINNIVIPTKHSLNSTRASSSLLVSDEDSSSIISATALATAIATDLQQEYNATNTSASSDAKSFNSTVLSHFKLAAEDFASILQLFEDMKAFWDAIRLSNSQNLSLIHI